MSRDDAPKIRHDTRIVIDVNEAGCALFRCERIALVDLDLLELLPGSSERDRAYRWLAALQLYEMRQGRVPAPFVYEFRRHDGTLFYGAAATERLDSGEFETTVLYLRDKRDRQRS